LLLFIAQPNGSISAISRTSSSGPCFLSLSKLQVQVMEIQCLLIDFSMMTVFFSNEHEGFFLFKQEGFPPTVILLNLKAVLQYKSWYKEGNKENVQNYTKLSSHSFNWLPMSWLALNLTQANSCLKTCLQPCKEWGWFLKMTSLRAVQMA
jgi:hypothetical protein